MLGEYRHGALAVVCSVETPTWVNDQLQRIDANLFAEKQLGFDGREVWCVVEDTGEQRGGDRYVTVYEFRGPDGEPVPYLHQAIVDEMQRRARDGSGNILAAREIVARRNAQRLEQKRRETDEHYHEIAKDFEDHRKIGHFTTLHRSPALARSRARATTARNDQLNAVAQAFEIARKLDRERARGSLVRGRWMPYGGWRWNGAHATSRLHGGKRGKAARRAASKRAGRARKAAR